VRQGVLGDLLDRLFEGSPLLLLNSLVEQNRISEAELRKIQKLIKHKEKAK
jgi:predicted transcriptional regulator